MRRLESKSEQSWPSIYNLLNPGIQRSHYVRVVVAGIVEFPPEVRDEALIKGKELIEGAYTEKGCIHYLWTADLNHPGRVVVYEEWESGC